MSIALKIWLTLLVLLIPAGVLRIIGDELDEPLFRFIGGLLATAFLAMTFLHYSGDMELAKEET